MGDLLSPAITQSALCTHNDDGVFKSRYCGAVTDCNCRVSWTVISKNSKNLGIPLRDWTHGNQHRLLGNVFCRKFTFAWYRYHSVKYAACHCGSVSLVLSVRKAGQQCHRLHFSGLWRHCNGQFNVIISERQSGAGWLIIILWQQRKPQ